VNLFKLFVLVYADDTVILSNFPDDFQNALNLYEQYRVQWDLPVNTSKAKSKAFKIYICHAEIKIVNDFKYLGITFLRSGEFKKKLKNVLPNRLLKLSFVCCNNQNSCVC